MKAPVLWLAGAAAAALLMLPPLAQAAQSAHLSLERHFQLRGLMPLEGQYVSYDATIKNTGDEPIAGMHLWLTFGSVAGSVESASFTIPELQPGESRQLSLGPFKMIESGDHRLYVGVNKSGSAAEPNDIMLNYSNATPADSFIVYNGAMVYAVILGAAFMAIGGVLVALYLKKRK